MHSPPFPNTYYTFPIVIKVFIFFILRIFMKVCINMLKSRRGIIAFDR